jgi:hypothetical protein
VRGLNFLIALASFGNMIAVIIGLSPLGPYAVIWGLTALMIVAVPAGDAFTFGKHR